MKRKIRCIYIDGIERSGKTSVVREIRRFFKENNRDLHEINGTTVDSLNKQRVLIEDNEKSVILKENSLLSVFYREFKEMSSLSVVEDKHKDLIRKEKNINHEYGAVHYFLVPETMESFGDRFDEDIPKYIPTLTDLFKSISLYSIAQGLDIRLITFDKFDKIYDIRDKILESLEKNYEI